MILILLSMTMFFAMLFATVNAIRNEARQDRPAAAFRPMIK